MCVCAYFPHKGKEGALDLFSQITMTELEFQINLLLSTDKYQTRQFISIMPWNGLTNYDKKTPMRNCIFLKTDVEFRYI